MIDMDLRHDLLELKKYMVAAQGQMPFAVSKAVHSLAWEVKKATDLEMRTTFDKPTPYTMRAIGVEPLRPDKYKPEATVGLRSDSPSKGTPWEAALSHQFTGGARHWKRFEAALMRAGLLLPGMAAVPPRQSSWAISLDQYGNVPANTIKNILSYFQALGNKGYSGNMSEKKKRQKMKMGVSESGYKTINGVQYFVARRLTNENKHLWPGIWAKRGIHGSDVAPVLLFVRRPQYQRRIDLQSIAARAIDLHYVRVMNDALDYAMATAK
jgi:hypothetical protein